MIGQDIDVGFFFCVRCLLRAQNDLQSGDLEVQLKTKRSKPALSEQHTCEHFS